MKSPLAPQFHQLFLILALLADYNHVLRPLFIRYRILGFQLLPRRPLNIMYPIFIWLHLFWLKSGVSLVAVSILTCHFLLGSLWDFLFFLGSSSLSLICLGEIFVLFILLGFIRYLEPVVWCLSSWKILNHYLFNIIPFSLLTFSDCYYI